MEMIILIEFSDADKEFLQGLFSDVLNSVEENTSEITSIQSEISTRVDFLGECALSLLIVCCFLWGSVLYISYAQRGIK